MKRFIGLFLALTVAIQGMTIFAVNAEEILPTYETQVEVLLNLGIAEDYSVDTYDPYSYIPNREFLSMLNNLTGGAEISDYDSYAKQIGAIEKNEKLQNFVYVTSDFALLAAMGALGYNDVTNAIDTDKRAWLLQKARSIGLADGIPDNKDMSLRRSQAVLLVYNMLKADVMDLQTISQDNKGYTATDYKISKDDALYYFRKIYHTEGVLDGTEFTEMYGESSVGGNRISVDGVSYEVSETADFDDYVGVLCDVYVEEDTKKALSVTPVESIRKLEISAEDLDTYDEAAKTISYLPENSSKSKKIRIEKTAAVISNGMGLKSYGKSDIEIPNGRIILYDNDQNGEYDVVKIETAKIFLVDGINYTQRTIYNKLSYDDGALSVTADERESDRKVSIVKNGIAIKMSDISANDVLEVYYNPNAERRIIKIVVASNSFQAQTESILDDETKIIAKGKEYELWESYQDGTDKGDYYTPKLKLGQIYTFYLSSGNEIVAAEVDKYEGMTGGYLYETSYDRDRSGDVYEIRIFTSNGSWESIKLAERIKLNGSNRKVKDCFAEIEAKTGTVILVKTNDEGMGTEIRTAIDRFVLGETSGNFTYSELDKTTDSSLRFRNVADYFEGTTTGNIMFFIGSATKIFAVPTAGEGDEGDFSMTKVGSIKNKQTYDTVKAYGVDKYGLADYVVIEKDDNVRKEDALAGTVMLVSKTFNVADSDGESVQVMVGPYEFLSSYNVKFDADAIEYSVAGDKMTTRTPVKAGDLVRFNLNDSGTVGQYSILCRASYAKDGNAYYPYEDEWRMHGSTTFMRGTFVSADFQKGAILLDVKTSPTAEEDLKSSVTGNNVKVYVCETNGRSTSTRIGTLQDIAPGDFVYVQAEWALVRTVVAYK